MPVLGFSGDTRKIRIEGKGGERAGMRNKGGTKAQMGKIGKKGGKGEKGKRRFREGKT